MFLYSARSYLHRLKPCWVTFRIETERSFRRTCPGQSEGKPLGCTPLELMFSRRWYETNYAPTNSVAVRPSRIRGVLETIEFAQAIKRNVFVARRDVTGHCALQLSTTLWSISGPWLTDGTSGLGAITTRQLSIEVYTRGNKVHVRGNVCRQMVCVTCYAFDHQYSVKCGSEIDQPTCSCPEL